MNRMEIPEPVKEVLDRLHECGYEAYVVGGCVRDALMGRCPGDYDVTTSALPEDTLRVFDGWRVVETGLQHGTVTVVHRGWNIEVTTFRIDGVYLDNRHPENVVFTRSLAEDLARRDFTVNAMAYAPDTGFIDLYGGMADLKKRCIRCVGSAEKRFREDGLRILRALRFSAVLDFTPARDDGGQEGGSTAEAIHALRFLLEGISRERIHAELTKLLCGTAAPAILTGYGDVLETILPMLSARHAGWYGQCMGRLPVGMMPCLHYAALFSLLDGAGMEEGLCSLKLSRAETRLIRGLWKRKDGVPDRYTLRKLAGEFDWDICRQWVLLLYGLERLGETDRDGHLAHIDALERERCCCSLRDLSVNGEDIRRYGITGAAIGQILSAMLEAVLRDQIPNDRTLLLEKFCPAEMAST